MKNYEHEIECPDNKAILCYLWYDYFHDSQIVDVNFDNYKKILTIKMECYRDADKRLKGDYEKIHEYIDSHQEEYLYVLYFKHVEYFHMERQNFCNDYINGRFKDTSLLKKLAESSGKTLYQIRIQVADGYCDIVFHDFYIRKAKGRVTYYTNEGKTQTTGAYVFKKDDELYSICKSGDDYDRFRSMQELWERKHKQLLEIARESIKLGPNFDDTSLYSAYILGKLGDKTDLTVLYNFYLNYEIMYLLPKRYIYSNVLLPKRIILDAIEEINYRNQKGLYMIEQNARLELLAKLAEAELHDKNGDIAEDFKDFSKKMREKVTGI